MIKKTHRKPQTGGYHRRHKHLVSRKTLVLFFTVSLATNFAAAADEKKEAAIVLDQFIEVTGGHEAYERVQNRVIQATLEFVGQNIKASVTVYLARPNHTYMKLEADAFGVIERGTRGEIAWENGLMTGPQLKKGEERNLMLRSSTFDAAVQWRKLFTKVEHAGSADVEGRPCHKIVLTAEHGAPETRYYDKETKLLVKTELLLDLPAGQFPLQSYTSDYREVDGITLAHQVRTLVAGQERILTTESVDHNVELPADRFDPPAEVQELLQKKEVD